MASFSFDASSVPPSTERTLIPADTEVLAHITDSELKPMTSGNGTKLSLTFTIIDGEYKNRKIWDDLNVQHSNPETQKIAQQDLSSLCVAVGVINLTDTVQLHNKPVKLKLKIRKDPGYNPKNVVSAYKPATAGAPAFSKPAAAPAVAPASGGTKAPWM